MPITQTDTNQEWRDGVLIAEEEVEVDVTADVVSYDIDVQARAALSDLKLIRDSSGSLTAAQLSNAVRLLARVEIGIIKRLLPDLLSDET